MIYGSFVVIVVQRQTESVRKFAWSHLGDFPCTVRGHAFSIKGQSHTWLKMIDQFFLPHACVSDPEVKEATAENRWLNICLQLYMSIACYGEMKTFVLCSVVSQQALSLTAEPQLYQKTAEGLPRATEHQSLCLAAVWPHTCSPH